MKTKRRFGYIMAAPAQFALHRRRGRTRKVGRGISFVCLPFIDRYYLIPSTAQGVVFCADQITAENQGVEVAGFAVWRIEDPEKAAACFDFADTSTALGLMSENLRNVVESAIRHQVANMAMEDVLRKRGSIILALKEELAYIAGQWGLLVETVEIRTVRILSPQLFSQMQAAFRNKLRLESETCVLQTEQELAQRRWQQKEQLALVEQGFTRSDLARRGETDRLKAEAEKTLQAYRIEQQLELSHVEQRLEDARWSIETRRKMHEAGLARIDDETKRLQIATANTEDTALALTRQLPAALNALSVADVHIGDYALQALARSLTRGFRKNQSTKSSDQ